MSFATARLTLAVLATSFACGAAEAANPSSGPRVWEADECTFSMPDKVPAIAIPPIPGRITIAPVPVPNVDFCEGRGTSVVAHTKYHVLSLCENGKAVATYDFVFGTGGVGKTQEGDAKTPLGTYSLSRARVSAQWGLFIHVGYPTKEQAAKARAQGINPGGAIGIHAPGRAFRCVGASTLAWNWTQGCLAMASDKLVVEVANWLEVTPQGRKIHIIR